MYTEHVTQKVAYKKKRWIKRVQEIQVFRHPADSVYRLVVSHLYFAV